MILETERLILRPWEVNDGEDLYKYAKSPLVGPRAGWEAHKTVEESKSIIEKILTIPNTYAVVLKETMKPIGSVGIMVGEDSNLPIADDEGEVGYWLGVPYWGAGIIPEAVKKLIKYGFEDLNLKNIWCGYFDGNNQSKLVQEKCGFVYHHSDENIYCTVIKAKRLEHISLLRKEDWIELEKVNYYTCKEI